MPSSNPIRAPRQYGTPDTISRRTSSPSRFFSPSRFLLAKMGARNRLRECARSPPRSLGLACPCPPSIGQLQPRAQRMHNATQLQSSFEFGAQWIVINNRYNNRKSCRGRAQPNPKANISGWQCKLADCRLRRKELHCTGRAEGDATMTRDFSLSGGGGRDVQVAR